VRSRLNEARWFTDPVTGEKRRVSTIRDECFAKPAPYDVGDWGSYVFGAWLEEDYDNPGMFYISFPYWRTPKPTAENPSPTQRFAGQYTLRAEPRIIRQLLDQIGAAGLV
jgi:hypothetical protein